MALKRRRHAQIFQERIQKKNALEMFGLASGHAVYADA